MSKEHLDLVVAVVIAIIASSGFWAFLGKITSFKSSERKMIMGLGHDRIIYLGMKYLERGYITQDEFENLSEYLYGPYVELGGNGSAKRIMDGVLKLPICNTVPSTKKENVPNVADCS